MPTAISVANRAAAREASGCPARTPVRLAGDATEGDRDGTGSSTGPVYTDDLTGRSTGDDAGRSAENDTGTRAGDSTGKDPESPRGWWTLWCAPGSEYELVAATLCRFTPEIVILDLKEVAIGLAFLVPSRTRSALLLLLPQMSETFLPLIMLTNCGDPCLNGSDAACRTK